ncbi:MAG: response regulator [Deltaproteobacteria bacterium]|nr:response regulator [Deltaproteobacteria bacterium]
MKTSNTKKIKNEIFYEYKILIVDDEVRILNQLEQDLCLEGFTSVKAKNAEHGLKLLSREKIAVIITDQKMPRGMSGTDFLTVVRKKYPFILGIILTAFKENDYLFDAINQAKAFSYLLKPWNKKELVNKIKEAMEQAHLNLQATFNDEKTFLPLERKKIEQFDFNQKLLHRSVHELHKTQKALKEARHALSAISEVTGNLAKRFEETQKVPEKHHEKVKTLFPENQ